MMIILSMFVTGVALAESPDYDGIAITGQGGMTGATADHPVSDGAGGFGFQLDEGRSKLSFNANMSSTLEIVGGTESEFGAAVLALSPEVGALSFSGRTVFGLPPTLNGGSWLTYGVAYIPTTWKDSRHLDADGKVVNSSKVQVFAADFGYALVLDKSTEVNSETVDIRLELDVGFTGRALLDEESGYAQASLGSTNDSPYEAFGGGYISFKGRLNSVEPFVRVFYLTGTTQVKDLTAIGATAGITVDGNVVVLKKFAGTVRGNASGDRDMGTTRLDMKSTQSF